MSARGYLLDTNVFNGVCKRQIALTAFAGKRLYATHVQRTELAQASEDLRTALLKTFADIAPAPKPTATAVWDDTPWDESTWSDDDGMYNALLARIGRLDKKIRPLNQSRDARIAEVAIKQELTLVTNDRKLAQAAQEHGCVVMTLEDLLLGASGEA
jgi:predicted nucleic acid-binding protein